METNFKDKLPLKKKYPYKWKNFNVISPKLAILKGNYSIFDKRFKFASRGLQGTATCVVAIVYSRLHNPKDWSIDHINKVLENGDKLFRLSQWRNKIKNQFMKTQMVYPEFFIDDFKCNFLCEPNKVRGNLFTESSGCPSIGDGVKKFFKDHEAGVLISSSVSVAIWRHTVSGKFWYFSPTHCDESTGQKEACLIISKDINDLVELFLTNLNEDSSYSVDKVTVVKINQINRSLPDDSLLAANKNVYTNKLTDRFKVKKKDIINKEPLTITISNYKIDTTFAQDPLIDQNNFDTGYDYFDIEVNVPTTFQQLSQDRAILHGFTHESSEVYKGKGAQNVANCISALAIKKKTPVRAWLRPKLDEILSLGDSLYLEVKNLSPAKRTIDFNDRKIQIEGKNHFIDVDLITVTGTLTSKAPDVLNLKQALLEFFLVNTDGVLECSSMATAVWSQDSCYYFFDPRQCDSNGERIKEEIKRKKKEVEVKKVGRCCVIKFPTIDSLADNFIDKVENKNDRFIISSVSVVDDIPGTRKWCEFEPGDYGKTWVLQGTISNEDEEFESAGMQGLAMPIVALVTAQEMAPQDWTKMAVDQVVKDGDVFYNFCALGEEEEMNLRNLKRKVYINNKRIKFDIEEAVVVGNSEDSLAEGLKKFLTDHQFAIVELGDLVVAVWKHEEVLPKTKGKEAGKEISYYCFDANPRGPIGEKNSEDEEAACVIRAVDCEEIARRIYSNAESEEFSIHSFQVKETVEMTPEEIEEDKLRPTKPSLGAFVEVDEDSACLYGTVDKNENAQAAVALVTLGMTKIYSPFLWSKEVVDDIVKLGSKVAEDNAEVLQEEERIYLLPNEIEEFDIGVNRISVQVEENATGVPENLVNMLQGFFAGNSAGILRQDKIMVPIWKESEVFFTFNPSFEESKENSTVFWFTSIPALAENIKKTFNESTNLILDSVDLESEYETRVAENERPKISTSDELWYNFSQASKGVWQILGNISLNDEKFLPENRGNQTAALAVMTVIFSKVYEPKLWSKEILDEVVVTADKLHSKTVECLGAVSNPRVNQVIPEFFLSSRRLDLTVRDCVESGKVESTLLPLKEGLERFFLNFSSGALTLGDINVGIWKSVDFFCVLPSSFSSEVKVLRFKTSDQLADYFTNLVDKEEDYEIHAIDVIDWNKLPPWKHDPSPVVRPSNLPALNAYREISSARAILQAGIHQASTIFPPSIRNRQTASNCVVALAMAVVKNSLTWTRKTLDEILVIGSKLHRESVKTTKGKVKPVDVVRVFHIGVNALTADVEASVEGLVDLKPPEVEVKGKKTKKPKVNRGKKKTRELPPVEAPPLLKQGIEEFWAINNAGILVIGDYMISLWKEHGVYFLWDPRARNKQGLKVCEVSEEGFACVMWFACLEPLFDVILKTIDEENKFGSFEIYRVIVNTLIVESLPGPVGFQAVLGEEMRTVEVKVASEFLFVDKELSVLKGSVHMSSKKFDITYRGYQSTAIAAVANAVAVLHVPSTWTEELVDAIVKYGDVLHRDSSRIRRIEQGRNLLVKELVDSFVVGDFRVTISIDWKEQAGILVVQDLAQALSVFFRNNCAGILHTSNLAVAVMQHYGKFYMFDPRECDKFGRSYYLDGDDNDKDLGGSGGACVAKCESIMRLASIFVGNCNYRVPCVYTINAVNVKSISFFSK